jgi:hypothetical protein
MKRAWRRFGSIGWVGERFHLFFRNEGWSGALGVREQRQRCGA